MCAFKLNGASAPAIAITAPTDRSMPPAAMTIAMPTATTTIGATRQLKVQHPSVVREVIAAVGAIEALARSLGVSARLARQRLLTPYDRTRVQSILAALS